MRILIKLSISLALILQNAAWWGSKVNATLSPAILLNNYQGGTDNAPASASTLTNPSFVFSLRDPLTTGSCLAFAVSYQSITLTIGTPTSALGNTIHAGPSQTANNATLQMYYILNATAGFDKITVPTTGTPTGSGPDTLFGVWATGAINCSSTTIGGTGSTTFTANGSAHNLTLSAAPSSGDFVVYYGWDTAAPSPTTVLTNAITVGSGYTLASESVSYGKVAQYCVTCTSTTIPITYAGTDTIAAVAMVFKNGSSGAAPAAGQRIINYQVENYGSVGAHATHFPCPGCTLITGLITSPDAHVTAVTSTGYTSTWAGFTLNTNYGVQSSVASIAQIIYGPSGTAGTSSASITPTFSASTAGFFEIGWAGIIGASTFDNGHVTNNINQTASGNLTADVITPATANDLCFNVTTLDFSTISGTVTDANGHTPLLLQAVDTLANNNNAGVVTGPSTLDEDDGRSVMFNTSATALTSIWSFTASNIGASQQDVSTSGCFK